MLKCGHHHTLQYCLDATYLTFKGVHYQRTFGTAMGSPVSVTVANLVMEEIEEAALSSYPGTPPCFWKRYVDNVHCSTHRVPDILHEHLNSINEHIQFTVEKEENGSLPFLDSLLTHESVGSISTSVYRKKTHIDQYLQFSSHHLLAHKKSVITTVPLCHGAVLQHS